jgi:hypothetical protein
MTKSQPGETSDEPNMPDKPPLELQNSKIEYPNAAVGTTNGISAKVSRMLIHLDLLRVINHAKGTPASRSKAATIKPIINEFAIAPRAVFTRSGWLRTLCTDGAFMRIPIIGGTRIIAKKMMMAER